MKESLGATAQELALFGVFDGHGQEGKSVSHHVCATLPRLVARSTLCKVGSGRASGGIKGGGGREAGSCFNVQDGKGATL